MLLNEITFGQTLTDPIIAKFNYDTMYDIEGHLGLDQSGSV
jgi:hypothetical protein